MKFCWLGTMEGSMDFVWPITNDIVDVVADFEDQNAKLTLGSWAFKKGETQPAPDPSAPVTEDTTTPEDEDTTTPEDENTTTPEDEKKEEPEDEKKEDGASTLTATIASVAAVAALVN